MRQSLQRLYRWIGNFRVQRPAARSRATAGLCLESLEERIVMTAVLDALPAPRQTFAVAPAVTTITLTSASVTSAVQGVTSAFSLNPSLAVSGAFSTTAYGGNDGLYGLTGSLPTKVTSQSPDVGGLDAVSPVVPQFLPPQVGPISTDGAGNPSIATSAQLALGPSAGIQTVAVPVAIKPSVASTPLSQAVDLQAAAFRLSRTPADASPLQVAFVQTAYGPTGAVAQEGTASFVPGSAHVDVPLAWGLEQPADPREIVTLTLRGDGGYRVAQSTATLFLVDATRGCSEAALIEAFRQGQSPEAFNALFQLHRSAVFQTCIGLLRNLADAEDVTQVVFLMLARQPLRLGMNMAGWLHTVARHACIGLLRSRSRRARHEKNAAKAEHVHSEDEATDLREELEVALAQLNPDLRDAVRLRYLEGWSQQQAAERVGCPRGTLSQRAARGVQTLRGILGCNTD